MPHANIWIRKEDYATWELLPNKAEFLSQALRGTTIHIEEPMPQVIIPSTPKRSAKEVADLIPGLSLASEWRKDTKKCSKGHIYSGDKCTMKGCY